MQAARRSTRVWAGFALPGVGWLLALFVVPVYAVVAVAFGQIDPLLRTPIPTWNPLQWDFSAMGDVLDRVLARSLSLVGEGVHS